MSPFQKRLRRVMRDGDLTISDLRNWFERPYHTVRSWIAYGRTPHGPSGRQALHDLQNLEELINRRVLQSKLEMLLSPTLSWSDRKKAIGSLKRGEGNAGHARLPTPHPSK